MDILCDIVQALFALAALGLIVVLVVAHLTAGMVNLTRHEKEKYFLTATGERKPFPSLHDPFSRELSVVIPAYNEELRMPMMLDEAMQYLENRQKQNPTFTYEVIVVDDGSRDKTTEVALRYTNKYSADKVRVLTLVKNRGKGGAVRMGTLSSRGKLILMADADGATKFSDLDKVEAGLKDVITGPVGFLFYFSYTVSYKCTVLCFYQLSSRRFKVTQCFSLNSGSFSYIIQHMLKKIWQWTSNVKYVFQP
uniref:ALG5 dolichyl-phosphate beta-glucosyltransferase n=1 Tax=Poecilia formosa TaxID=48698 RepID=A0A087YD84_POEFO